MNVDFPQIDITEYEIKDIVSTLKIVNDSIAKLVFDKTELEKKLMELLKHDHVGRRTYNVGFSNVEITTEITYKLFQDKFEQFNRLEGWKFNPVTVTLEEKFHLTRAIIRDCKKYGSEMDKNILKEIIKESKNKLSVKVLPAINGDSKCQIQR